MGFNDIFKKSFLLLFSDNSINIKQAIILLLVAAVIGCYIYCIYKVTTRKEFYSKHFNISLVALCVIVAGIIISMQSSIVISLGMVGALSIVRFRTAIKDPLDLVFLFWAISVGIICGAGLISIALIVSIMVTIIVFGLDKMPTLKMPMIIIVHAEWIEGIGEEIMAEIKKHSKYVKIKSKNRKMDKLEMVAEVNVSEDDNLVDCLYAIKNVHYVSLVSHDGEVTF